MGMRTRRGGPWTAEEERFLREVACHGDVAYLADLFNRTDQSVAEKLDELGVEEGPARPERFAWCPQCGRPRTEVGSDGRCAACREKEGLFRLRRRWAILRQLVTEKEVRAIRATCAGVIEDADTEAARAARAALAVEVEAMEEFLARRERRRGRTA